MKIWSHTAGGSARFFLHGFSGAPTTFDRLVAALPADRAQVAPTLLGHGCCGGGSFSGEVARIASLINEHQLPRVHLIAYSMGARLALALLVDYPHLVERATLIGVNPGLAHAHDRSARRLADERWIHCLEHDGIEAFVDDWEAMPMWASQRRLPESTRAAQRAVRLAHDPRELARAIRVLGLGQMPCYLPRLDEVTLPVQLLVGQCDERFTHIARAMQQCNPRFDMAAVDGCGHNPILERPDLVAAHIVDWEVAIHPVAEPSATAQGVP